ncbi:hypothetical protein TorRG33x02_198360 [Trema orientale]|uniref:Uncharacterized protein n=1 Tax=Trema orientale TaxID=63057 RepID=A0A2P5EFU0_TREOI|nr:hypothetical protein TorRG33x02_198360 [Trema orientale]
MTDFPPNPEDGELWIPSDVLHDIVSSNNVRSQKDYDQSASTNHNFAHNNVPNVVLHQPKKSMPIPSAKPKPRPKSQVHTWRPPLHFSQTQMPLHNGRFPGTTVPPNGIGSTINWIPRVQYGSFQVVPRSNINTYNPTQMQPSTQNQMTGVREMSTNFGPKHRGTGVFLPRSTTLQKKYEIKTHINQDNDGGAKIFLGHGRLEIVTTTIHNKKKSKS